LKTLDVSNNELKDLPNEIGLMKNLVRINIEGNPLKIIK
jgi:Leucine-rich repeat (LRR) protein